MTQLKAIIDREKETATFFGPGTFAAKDEIKKLGPANWNGEKKVWQVRPFTLSASELQGIFPSIVVEEGDIDDGASAALDKIVTPEDNRVPEHTREDAVIPESLTVSELARTIRETLINAFPLPVFIRGVLTKVSSSKGRLFLSLSDARNRDEELDAVIWRDVAQVCEPLLNAGFKLEPDLEIMIEATVRLSSKGGRVSLHVERIVAEYTIGKLAALREITNGKLKAEGVFGLNKEKELSFLPVHIGILTSAAGTVMNDFRSSLEEAKFGFRLSWLQVSVQGKDAKREIVRGLQTLESLSEIDAIVVIRGGGSPAELSAFNDYDVAKAICLCSVPVMTAVGHQADQSSAQDVSYRAFGVPKEVGWFLASIIIDLRRRYQEATQRIRGLVSPLVEGHAVLVEKVHQAVLSSGASLVEGLGNHIELTLRLVRAVGERIVSQLSSQLSQAFQSVRSSTVLTVHGRAEKILAVNERLVSGLGRMLQGADSRLSLVYAGIRGGLRVTDEQQLRLERFEQMLHEASPEVQLQRGFALIRKASTAQNSTARYVVRGVEVVEGEMVSIEFFDQTRKAIIKGSLEEKSEDKSKEQ